MARTKRRSQSAVEYLMVIGIMTAILVPLVVYNFSKTTQMKEDVLIADSKRIGNDITSSVEDVYYAPGFAKRTLDVQVPAFVDRIYTEPDAIVFDIMTNSGPSTLFFKVDVPLIVSINLTSNQASPIYVKKDINAGQYVVVCNADLCTKKPDESGLCNDGIDNDWDFKTDACDEDCGGPC